MPIEDPLGSTVPAPEDPADIVRWIRTLALTAPPIVTVTSRVHANSVRGAYHTACIAAGVTPKMLWVWRTDIANLERDTGTGWEYVAGRQHGATVTFARTGVSAATDPPRAVFPTAFVRSSDGWTLDSSSSLIVPQSGMYAMSVNFQISGAASTLGRSFFQLVAQDTAFGNRFPAFNEDNWGGTIIWPLSKGNALRLQAYHSAGGTRDYAGTLQIAMLNAPNW